MLPLRHLSATTTKMLRLGQCLSLLKTNGKVLGVPLQDQLARRQNHVLCTTGAGQSCHLKGGAAVIGTSASNASSASSSDAEGDRRLPNRWTMLVPAFLAHVCIGAPYGWSAVSGALSREAGFVAAAAGDWAIDLVSYPMSIMLVAAGVSAAASGKWSMKVGVTRAMTAGGAVYGLGFAVAAAGVAAHSLPLLYAGNGAVFTLRKD